MFRKDLHYRPGGPRSTCFCPDRSGRVRVQVVIGAGVGGAGQEVRGRSFPYSRGTTQPHPQQSTLPGARPQRSNDSSSSGKFRAQNTRARRREAERPPRRPSISHAVTDYHARDYESVRRLAAPCAPRLRRNIIASGNESEPGSRTRVRPDTERSCEMCEPGVKAMRDQGVGEAEDRAGSRPCAQPMFSEPSVMSFLKVSTTLRSNWVPDFLSICDMASLTGSASL